MRLDGPFVIVFNIGSGRGDREVARAAVERVIVDAGRRCEFFVVDPPARLPQVARRAVQRAIRLDGIVVAAGGDGTINTVAQAALPSGRPFGVLPQGTFNYFGRTHGIPEEPEAAARALIAAELRPVQIGLVNDRVFLVNASLGLYPRVVEDREAVKRQLGRSRPVALWAGLLTVLRYRRQWVLELEADGLRRVLRTPTLVVGNNELQLRRVGIAEAEALRQGQLAAVALRPVSTLGLIGLMLRGALGRLGEAEQILSFAFSRLTVRPRLPYGFGRMKVAIDGEVLWLDAPLVFRPAPRPLMLMLPPTTEDKAAA